MEQISALKMDTNTLQKLLKKSFKKNDSTHDMRVFFKKLKAHIVLVHVLGWPQSVDFSDLLRTYYLEVWFLRDAKIFRSLCKKFTHNNKLIMVLWEERVVQAKEKVRKYKKSIDTKELAKEIEQLTTDIVNTLHTFELKRIEAWLETFFEHTENLLSQLLQSDWLTHVWFHTIRKHIKKVIYLLDYMCFFDKIKYAPIQKKYKKIATQLGEWNDLQLLVQQLDAFPRTGKEEKIVKKLLLKEEKMRKKLLKKLRVYFRVSPAQAIKSTERISLPIAEKQVIQEEVKQQETIIDAEKPVVKKAVVKKAVVKKAVVKKAVVKKAVVKKAVVKKAVVKKPNTPWLS